ncbi:HNH endonuclease [Burkholderiaceae bacterium DAT-1]|nr:HNH endonuclease [Burkholderiaceae bacterium DAT-1]
MKRRLREPETWYVPPSVEICPLCGREIPASQRDEHHLVPRLKGGKVTTALHRICHKQIHARFTEAELARQYNSVEALLAHPDIQTFVAWVAKKPPEFAERAFKSKHKH